MQYAKLKTKEQIMKKNIYPYMAGGLALLGIAAATPFTPIPQDNAQPAGSFATDTGTYYYTHNGTPVEIEKETEEIVIEESVTLLKTIEQKQLGAKLDSLQNEIEQKIVKMPGTIEVYFEYLPSRQSFSINNKKMYPCSVIKLFVMAATYDQIFQGTLSEKKCTPYLEDMIIISDNTSYNVLLTMIGKGNGMQGIKKVNSCCTSLGLKNTTLHHALLPGNNYFTDGKENVSTPEDVGKLLEKIQAETLPYSSEMLALLKQCEEDSGLPAGLPEAAVCAHKSGWADTYYMDAGIIDNQFILVVFTKDAKKETVSTLCETTYQYLEKEGLLPEKKEEAK